MTFEHTETGLRLKIKRIDRFDTFETVMGVQKVLVGVDLVTECGQVVSVEGGRIELDFASAWVVTREGEVAGVLTAD